MQKQENSAAEWTAKSLCINKHNVEMLQNVIERQLRCFQAYQCYQHLKMRSASQPKDKKAACHFLISNIGRHGHTLMTSLLR